MASGKVRLYGCGGAGINIVSFFAQALDEVGSAELLVSAIDTSRSNLHEGVIENDQMFILPDVDGSGKLRKQNHAEISASIQQMLVKQPAEEFNIVVFSASGGSGSVIGPLLVSELLNRKQAVVAVVIGSEESFITAQNTLNTLKSLEAIALKQQAPVIMSYAHNRKDVPRAEADTYARFAIAGLSVLASGLIAEMDTQDIANFLQYQRVTSAPARLAALTIVKDPQALSEVKDVIALANVFKRDNETPLPITPEYVATGYSEMQPVGGKSLHYAINIDNVVLTIRRMNELVGDLDKVRKATTFAPVAVSDKDEITDDGLVL